jgi:hypothetical protein
MAKFGLRLQAHKLRRRGMSIKAIAVRLGVSTGSVSAWCRALVLTHKQRERLYKFQVEAGHNGRLIGAEMNRQKRLLSIADQEARAKQVIGPLNDRDKLMLGTALYWGEGVKARDSATSIVNSDPTVVLFARNWFEQIGVRRADFSPYVFIADTHQNRRNAIVNFWSQYLNIPKRQFPTPIFLKTKHKKVYENHNSYYGVVALRVRKGAVLKQFILGLIKACKAEAGVAQVVRASHS